MNKCDLVKDEVFKKKDVMYVSSLTGQGISELIEEILARLGVDEGSETPFLARKRHQVSLSEALYFVNLSIQEVKRSAGLELIAENLRLAHESLGEVLRPMSSDDLLGEIFSKFCIGK